MWRTAGLVLAMLMMGTPAGAHTGETPADAPPVADRAEWYLSGEPLLLDGHLYYRTGPIRHFNAREMIRSGYVGSVPVYTRTTEEPRSIVYVPLSGGLVRPYERRRQGDLAGTVGSSAPAFPVSLAAAEPRWTAAPLRAPGPPTEHPVGMWGHPAARGLGAASVQPSGAPIFSGEPAGTSGTLRTARPAVGLNAAFIDFQAARWFLAGSPVLFDAARFERAGEYSGFAVYTDPARAGTIFIPVVDGPPGLLTPYASRQRP